MFSEVRVGFGKAGVGFAVQGWDWELQGEGVGECEFGRERLAGGPVI